MKSTIASGLMLAAAVALSACGGAAGGGGDLAGRLAALCIKERGEAGRMVCECEARVTNTALSEEDRKLAMISVEAEEGRFKTKDDLRKALEALGVNAQNAEEKMGAFVQRMMLLEAKAIGECGAA